jgi:lipopolysaccharide/colanic/teichoic acid biosynthesis glycosyltransferase
VLPDKIGLAKEYIRRSSLLFDLAVIFRTLRKVFHYKVSH